jgi:DNA-directed RNA polymerase subunit N (RpoN/RPB10)
VRSAGLPRVGAVEGLRRAAALPSARDGGERLSGPLGSGPDDSPIYRPGSECPYVGKINSWRSSRSYRADGDVVSVRISERKLHSSSAGICVWLFLQPADQSPRPWQSHIKVVDPEDQEEVIARLGVLRICQRGMLVGTPLVETQQDRSIRVENLPKVVVGRSSLRQTK